MPLDREGQRLGRPGTVSETVPPGSTPSVRAASTLSTAEDGIERAVDQPDRGVMGLVVGIEPEDPQRSVHGGPAGFERPRVQVDEGQGVGRGDARDPADLGRQRGQR